MPRLAGVTQQDRLQAANFTTSFHHYHAPEEDGARVISVESEDGLPVHPDKLLEAIDEETALVSVCHVLCRDAC